MSGYERREYLLDAGHERLEHAGSLERAKLLQHFGNDQVCRFWVDATQYHPYTEAG